MATPKLIVLLAAFVFTSSLSGQTPDSCRDFVQHFYDEYLKNDVRSANYAMEVGLHSEQFSPTLRGSLIRESKKREIGAIDFDPFLNAQDWDASYKVGEVSVHEGKCLVQVRSASPSSLVELSAELQYANQTWRFTDFIYPRRNGRVRLTSLLKKDASR